MSQNDPIDALVARFPRLFRGERPWAHSSLPEGWVNLVALLFEDLDCMVHDADASYLVIGKIKEKLGRLRVGLFLRSSSAVANGADELNFRMLFLALSAGEACGRGGERAHLPNMRKG